MTKPFTLGRLPVETIDDRRIVIVGRTTTHVLAAHPWPHFAHLEQVEVREWPESEGNACEMWDGEQWVTCKYEIYLTIDGLARRQADAAVGTIVDEGGLN